MIDILLPLYNGERYLSQQLDSIFGQSYKNWRLLVRDDGSTDNSVAIIKEYISKYPKKIVLIEDQYGNKGTTGCINIILGYVCSGYFMFCDQDDIWEPNKIEVTMKEMNKLEIQFPGKPLLVCSDACCIDGNGNTICSSFFSSQKFIDATDNVHKLLALNVVQGSTELMNKKAKEVIYPIPNGLYHDWWTAVNVVFYGKVYYIHQPLMRYRQHNSNVVGALNVGPRYLLQKLSHIKNQMGIYCLMYKSLRFKPSIIKWVYYKLVFNLQRF